MMKRTITILIIVISGITAANAGARYFVNGGVDNNWGTTGNWSLTSGGAGGQAVPTASDDVYFDANSPNCTVNASARVAKTLTCTGYTLTITMTNGITVSGNVTLGANMSIAGTSALTVDATGTLTSNGVTWPNGLTFKGTSQTYTLADNWTISGTLTNSGTTQVTLNSNTLNIGGGINITTTATTTGTTTLVMNGTGTWQTSGGWLYNNLTFNTSGTITVSGTVRYGSRTLTYTAGTMVVTGSTLWLSSSTMTINTSGMTWNSISSSSATGITLSSDLYYTGNWTLTNTTVVNSHNIYHTGSSGGLNLGSNTYFFRGTTTLNLTGTGSITSNNAGRIGTNLVINTSGTYTVTGSFIYETGTLTYTAGTVVTTNSTLSIDPPATLNTNGITWNNVTFNNTSSAANATISSALTVSGTLTYSGTKYINFNGGNIDASGDITLTNTDGNGGGGTGTLNIVGASNQTLTGTGVAGSGRLPNVTINKSGGTLTLASIISCAGDLTYTAGTVDPSSSTFAFTGTKNLDGEGSSATMPFNMLYIYSGTTTLTGNLITNSDLKIYSGATLTQNSKLMSLGGNWDNSGTYTTSSAMVTFTGTGDKTLTKSSGSETFNRLCINKSSGTYTLNNPIIINDSLKFVSGNIISTATNYVKIADDAKASGASNNSYVVGYVKKIGNDAFTFPMGKGTSNYHPLTITAPSNTTDDFSAEYYNSAQGYGSGTDGTINNLSTCEYWVLNRNAGSSTVSATLNWNSNSCLISSSLNNMLVARWNSGSSQWVNEHNGGTTGNSTTGSVTSGSALTAYGPLALAQCGISASISSTDANDTICYGQALTLTASGGGTYSWSTGATTTTISPAPTSVVSYSVIATNSYGCTAAASRTITGDASFTAAAGSDVTICNCSSTTLGGSPSALGGTSPYSYSWNPSTGLSFSSMANPVGHPTVTTGYTLTVTDHLGCTASDPVLVTLDVPSQAVTLIDFASFPENDEMIRTEWATNGAGVASTFVVERSLNGIDFLTIGTVPGTTATSYFFYDTDPPAAGPAYYRVRVQCSP